METPDQDLLAASHSSSSTGCPAPTAAAAAMLKRKRTKRPPPLPRAIAASSSASSADAVSAATEEEEDMAHCLILLAQGRGLEEKFTSRKFTEATTTAGGKAGFYVYECKTCNKCFPSFQALGGHRASHKKPRLSPLTVAGASTATEEKIQIAGNDHGVEGLDVGIGNAFSSKSDATPAAAANSPNKMRVHECSICGAEFSSGQALGGHMRRHRPIGAPQEPQEPKKERNVLSLDLNLPAPSDENTPIAPSPVAAFSFANNRPMVFSQTSALVDCHY